MRKTFLTICAAAFALLAVSSCGKLEDGLNSLKGELADLKERVDALEQKLNTDVQAINSVIATLATKQEVTTGLNNLKAQLDAKDAELAAAIQSVTTTLNGLDNRYVGKTTYEAALAELQAGNTALQTQLQTLAGLLGETSVADVKAEILAELAEAVSNVAVQSVTPNEDGTYTLTLASGQSFTVAEPDPNANNTGLVTVQEGQWVVCKEDGTYEPIGVPVGVEDLEFSVDYETKELMFSVNGGELQGTGAYVTDWDGCLVTDFYEDDDFVYFTIGGEEYTLVKATEATSDLLAGKTYFTAEQTKVIAFEVKDVKSGFVASAPKGWKAELDFAGKTLTVTAPAEGQGVVAGLVEVWFLTKDGVVINTVLQVEAGDPLVEITVDPATNEVSMAFNQVEGETVEVIYGATLASEFTDEYVADLIENLLYAESMGAFSNNDPANPDNAALRKTSFKGTVADLVPNADYNAKYVVWAIQPTWVKGEYSYSSANTASDFIKVYHQMKAMNFSYEAGLSDAKLSVELLDENAQGFYGLYLNPWYADMIIAGMESGSYPVFDVMNGMFGTEAPCTYYANNTETIDLKFFGVSEEMQEYEIFNMLTPLSTSTICIIPYYADKTDYTFADVIVENVSTKEVTLGSTLEYALAEEVQEFTSYSMTFEAADAAFVMYEVYGPSSDEPVPSTDEDVLAAMSEYAIPREFEYGTYEGALTISNDASWGEEPGDEYTFVVVFIDENAKATVFKKTVATKALPVNESLSATIDAYLDELTNKSTAKFTITGDAVKLYYTCNTSSSMDMDNQIDVYNGESSWTEVDLSSVELTEGVYQVEGFKLATSSWRDQYNYVHAILVDAEGKVSNIFKSSSFLVPKGYVAPTE